MYLLQTHILLKTQKDTFHNILTLGSRALETDLNGIFWKHDNVHIST